MSEEFSTVAYLTAGVCFILSLSGLSKQETARRGNLYGILGMVIAVAATAMSGAIQGWEIIVGAGALGGLVGLVLAKRVAMTAMPELVALLNAFGGLAAVLVGLSTYMAPGEATLTPAEQIVHLVEICVGIAIGSVTFFGSVIAWAKLGGRLSGQPLLLPFRHVINAALTAVCVALMVLLMGAETPALGLEYLLILTALTAILGIHLVMSIGGADMPVVVSLLNSYSGWAAAAAGFMLRNDLLIITGALVGSSGAILSIIMCRAMNRSLMNVFFGGFGVAPTASSDQPAGEVVAVEVAELAKALLDSKRVVIVPGYGMAVARAQHPVKDLVDILTKQNVEVLFGIHPVAGRMPGHMNVLLAEAGVSYDIVREMEEVNEKLADTGVVLVIGANDIVNPSAIDDEASAIYGMPVIEVWNAGMTVVLKRGMAAGYAGIENPLFFKENNRMLFGDAKDSIESLVAALRAE